MHITSQVVLTSAHIGHIDDEDLGHIIVGLTSIGQISEANCLEVIRILEELANVDEINKVFEAHNDGCIYDYVMELTKIAKYRAWKSCYSTVR